MPKRKATPPYRTTDTRAVSVRIQTLADSAVSSTVGSVPHGCGRGRIPALGVGMAQRLRFGYRV